MTEYRITQLHTPEGVPLSRWRVERRHHGPRTRALILFARSSEGWEAVESTVRSEKGDAMIQMTLVKERDELERANTSGSWR